MVKLEMARLAVLTKSEELNQHFLLPSPREKVYSNYVENRKGEDILFAFLPFCKAHTQ